MGKRSLRIITIIIPILFWITLIIVRRFILRSTISWSVELVLLLVFSGAVVLFSSYIFRIIEDREAMIQRRSNQLAALNEAALSLTMELDLSTVLQKVVDLARELVHAQYGALGVLDEKGERITQFITSGISDEERMATGDPPIGRGLIGLLIKEGESIRINNIDRDPRSSGFPAGHPHGMKTMVGVPIQSKGKIIGNLYLTNKLYPGGVEDIRPFSQRDMQILEMFATQAAIAIENAQLYRQTQQLAILEERERFGMDLHDGIIQSIYAVGLMLEDTQHSMKVEPSDADRRIQRAIYDLNDVISDIRNYILDLRPQRFQGRNLQRGLEELARELRANTFLNVHLRTDQNGFPLLSPENTVEILHIVQEALTNVRKHARASNVVIRLKGDGSYLLVSVEDNGIGIPTNEANMVVGNGLRNMRERANVLMGELSIEPGDPNGTCVRLRVPLNNGSGL